MKTKTAQSSPAAKIARRDRIVLEHLPLVKAIAVRVHENLPVHVDLDDLVHAGVLGLFDAASKFNPEKQVAFSSYAKHRIKGAILDSLRQLDWASRDLRRRPGNDAGVILPNTAEHVGVSNVDRTGDHHRPGRASLDMERSEDGGPVAGGAQHRWIRLALQAGVDENQRAASAHHLA